MGDNFGVSIADLMKFYNFTKPLPIRKISRMDISAIANIQTLELGGNTDVLGFCLLLKGVMKTFNAVERGQNLEELKKANPLLVSEVVKGKYALIDGNHRMVIQWDDVSFVFVLTCFRNFSLQE